MKKYGKAITIIAAVFSTVSSLAQSNNLSSLHNYKRPAEKKHIQENQMQMFVVESSSSNTLLESNSSANYKMPATQRNVKSEIALRPIRVASGSELEANAIALRNYKQGTPFGMSKNNATPLNPEITTGELKKEEKKMEMEKNHKEAMEK
jgi:hypothetical protein